MFFMTRNISKQPHWSLLSFSQLTSSAEQQVGEGQWCFALFSIQPEKTPATASIGVCMWLKAVRVDKMANQDFCRLNFDGTYGRKKVTFSPHSSGLCKYKY
ncbi:hypothetical protein ILYODFUR_007323 [Ilyodon furcidens]|uniref:Uncharacterized protein n=1 Tax=Ilyodon furcidens TaxID=33524 RepID=A0ABV0T718_9TELE